MKLRSCLTLTTLAALLALPMIALAHPLGNFTINQYLAVHVEPDLVELDFIVDRAEIPASQVLGGAEFIDRENPTRSELTSFAQAECEVVASDLAIAIDNRPVGFSIARAVASAPEGAGGLPTLRTECLLRGEIDLDGASVLSVQNGNFLDRIGWTEIVVTASGVAVDSTLDVASVTDRLTSYPTDRLESPPDIRGAVIALTVDPGVERGSRFVPAAEDADVVQSAGDRFSSLLDEADGGVGALMVALGVAFVLGAGHAAAPGHGKTVMAASLIGTRGRVRHALILGLSVAISHTAGVFILGVITFAASAAFAPEAVFPYLAAVSGIIVTAIGGWIFWQWLRSRRIATQPTTAHDHDHEYTPDDDHERSHEHGDAVGEPHSHGFGGTHTHAVIGDREITWKLLATLGLSGGLVPSVSAILLLLAAINIGRVGMGLVLILVFGIGMATTLVGVGIGVVFIGERGLARFGRGGTMARLQRYLTPVAGAVVTIIGVALVFRALADII